MSGGSSRLGFRPSMFPRSGVFIFTVFAGRNDGVGGSSRLGFGRALELVLAVCTTKTTKTNSWSTRNNRNIIKTLRFFYENWKTLWGCVFSCFSDISGFSDLKHFPNPCLPQFLLILEMLEMQEKQRTHEAFHFNCQTPFVFFFVCFFILSCFFSETLSKSLLPQTPRQIRNIRNTRKIKSIQDLLFKLPTTLCSCGFLIYLVFLLWETIQIHASPTCPDEKYEKA